MARRAAIGGLSQSLALCGIRRRRRDGKESLHRRTLFTINALLRFALLSLQSTDFIDNSATNKVIASALGSNLSIVQIRQDFSKNRINVLQTGLSNLTLADTNEEAANSQALSTRQSTAVSVLAPANQSQQSVLQLLR
jgi:Bacterial flagellin C-terminal helical region